MGSLRRPASAPRWLAASLGVTLVAALLGLLVLGLQAGPATDAGRSGALGRVGQALLDPTTRNTATVAEIRRLLDRRSAAVLHRDRLAFLATVDPGSPAFRRSQGALFDALGPVPLSTWSYRLDAQQQRSLPADRRARYAAPTYLPAVVVLSYGLRGFDATPARLPMYLTFVHRPAGWLLASDLDLDGTGVRTAREPWDFGPVTVVTGRSSLVLGHPKSRAMLPRLAAEADRAVLAVTAVWGGGWAQRAVLVVPDNVTELARLLEENRDVSRLAAVATAWSTPGAWPVGQRVLLNPTNFARLGPLGRRVVLTHEITHLATRAVTAPATPTWLVEGFADYVAYRTAAVPVRLAAAELAADVRAGRLPAALPSPGRFDGADPRIAQAYEEGWLACRLIAESGGPSALVRFYRAAAARGDPPTRLSAAFRDILGTTQAAFTTRWRSYVRAQLS